MFFTIITATRNAAAMLPCLLESLACQTCRDFELIIQDGASTDGTVAVVESYRDRLPALSLDSAPDWGIYDAWNKALPRIRGEWVLFLGADDRLFTPDTLECCKNLLQSCSSVIRYAVGGVALCDGAENTLTIMPGQTEGVVAHLPQGYAPFWQNGLFHRAGMFSQNRFDDTLRIFGDYDFLCRTWTDDASAVRIPYTIAAIKLGGMSNSPKHLVSARLEALRVSRRHYGNNGLPILCLAVFKAGIVWGIYTILGPDRGSRVLNMLRRMRGLEASWVSGNQPSPSCGQPPPRHLNRGYLYHNKIAMFGCSLIDALLRFFPRKKRELPKKVRSILLIKPDHLGDLFLMGSVLPLLQQRYPDCGTDLVAGSWSMPIAQALPGIRKVFFVDHWMLNRAAMPFGKKLFFFFRSFFSTLRQIRRQRYDICLCFRSFGGNLISLGYLSKAAFLAGHGTGGLGPLLDAEAVWQAGRHEVEHFMEVLALCGIYPVPLTDLRYPVLRGADAARYEAVKQKLGIGSNYVVLAPCSRDAARMLPNSYWQEIIRQSPETHFVLSAGVGDRETLLRIQDGNAHVHINAGDFTLPDIILLLSKATHIHAVNSLGAHLAGASGAPTTVHWCSNGTDVRQFIPLGQQVSYVLVKNDELFKSGRNFSA
jgi:ADP-heptose:LPS heptosyltransferase